MDRNEGCRVVMLLSTVPVETALGASHSYKAGE